MAPRAGPGVVAQAGSASAAAATACAASAAVALGKVPSTSSAWAGFFVSKVEWSDALTHFPPIRLRNASMTHLAPWQPVRPHKSTASASRAVPASFTLFVSDTTTMLAGTPRGAAVEKVERMRPAAHEVAALVGGGAGHSEGGAVSEKPAVRAAEAGRLVDEQLSARYLKVLERAPLFQALSRRHRGRIARLAQFMDYHNDEVIVRDGDPGDSFYVVLEGDALAVRRRGTSGFSPRRIPSESCPDRRRPTSCHGLGGGSRHDRPHRA